VSSSNRQDRVCPTPIHSPPFTQLSLLQTVDTDRNEGDGFKLPPALRTQVDADFAALEAADSNTALTESDRAGGSAEARVALDKLHGLLKEGFNFITAIRSTQISAAKRLEIFTAYGWASGKLGRFNDARILGLARLAGLPHANLAEDQRYPGSLIADIIAQLDIFDAKAEPATGGDREVATRLRDTKLDLANTTLAQVRFYYCSASRDTDQTPELSKIGFQPRRDSGTVNHHKTPTPPAGPTPPTN
jgi:hypothetical protein